MGNTWTQFRANYYLSAAQHSRGRGQLQHLLGLPRKHLLRYCLRLTEHIWISQGTFPISKRHFPKLYNWIFLQSYNCTIKGPQPGSVFTGLGWSGCRAHRAEPCPLFFKQVKALSSCISECCTRGCVSPWLKIAPWEYKHTPVPSSS